MSRVFASFVIVLLTCSVVRAQDGASAAELLAEGVELRRQGRDAEALERFERAHTIAPSPQALAQIALAEHALGRYARAEARLETALREGEQDPWIVDRREALEGALASIGANLGTLALAGGVDGAEVVLDGEVIGVLAAGARLRVPAGSATLVIRAPGYHPVERAIAIEAGAVIEETIALEAIATIEEAPPPAPESEPPPPEPVAEPPAPAPPALGAPHPSWGMVAGGVAVLATGWAALVSVALVTESRMERLSVSASPIAGPWLLLSPLFARRQDPGVVAGLVLDGVAQAAGATLAIIGLFTRERSPLATALGTGDGAPELALIPWAGSDGAGLALSLTHL